MQQIPIGAATSRLGTSWLICSRAAEGTTREVCRWEQVSLLAGRCADKPRARAPQNDFTPEEEEEVRRENQWAFE